MLSHDGKELSPNKLHRLRVYQRTLVIPPEWRGHTPKDTLFVQCDDCSNVKPIFQFYQTARKASPNRAVIQAHTATRCPVDFAPYP